MLPLCKRSSNRMKVQNNNEWLVFPYIPKMKYVITGMMVTNTSTTDPNVTDKTLHNEKLRKLIQKKGMAHK